MTTCIYGCRCVGGQCAAASLASCGDGVRNGNEECDDSSACCVQARCELAAGAQCSGGNECCDEVTCRPLPTSATCAAGAGICLSGRCLTVRSLDITLLSEGWELVSASAADASRYSCHR